MRLVSLVAAVLVGSWSSATPLVKPPVIGKKAVVVAKGQPAKPKQGLLIANAKPVGENGQKDDGQQNQKDDGQQGQNGNGQQGQNGNEKLNELKGVKKH